MSNVARDLLFYATVDMGLARYIAQVIIAGDYAFDVEEM